MKSLSALDPAPTCLAGFVSRDPERARPSSTAVPPFQTPAERPRGSRLPPRSSGWERPVACPLSTNPPHVQGPHVAQGAPSGARGKCSGPSERTMNGPVTPAPACRVLQYDVLPVGEAASSPYSEPLSRPEDSISFVISFSNRRSKEENFFSGTYSRKTYGESFVLCT